VWNLISTTVDQNVDVRVILGDGLKDKNDMLRYINLGSEGMGRPEGRVWMLDPLDGTVAFVSGGQYAVCLALLEDGEQKVRYKMSKSAV
jgi:3'(2'), 5'-bisphosphate nucleotidase